MGDGVSEWVRPAAAEVVEVERETLRLREAAGSGERARLDGVLAGLTWVSGEGAGPVTSRSAPASRGEAVAEVWAAAAVADGGGTTQRDLRRVCTDQGVPYRAPDLSLGLDYGFGAHQVLSWLSGCLDGWERGRRAPVEVPAAPAQ